MNILKFKYLSLLFGIYLATMLASLTLCNRVTILFGIHIVGSSIFYPICFLIGDIIAEVYGYNEMRKITWVAFLCAILFAVYLELVNLMPAEPNYLFDQSYNVVIPPIMFITFLGVTGITIGQFIDTYFLTKWKILVKGRYFWLRCLGSTFIGALVTTFIGYTNRLYSLPFEEALKFILAAYTIKLIGVIILATPCTIIVILLKKAEPHELLRINNVDFNPFKLN